MLQIPHFYCNDNICQYHSHKFILYSCLGMTTEQQIKKALHFDSLLVVPPMSSIENQHICISPLMWNPVHLIQSQSHSHPIRCTRRRSSLHYKIRWSIVFDGAVEIFKLECQEACVLCNWAPINLVHPSLVWNYRREHTKEWFPLVPSNWITNKNQSLVP